MSAPVGRRRGVLATDAAAFEERVAAEAATLKEELAEGTFDNPQAFVGLEQEFYAVDGESCALRRVPRPLVRYVGFEKERGLHDAEMHTSSQPFNVHGVKAQCQEVSSRLLAAQNRTRIDDIRLVMDGMWTIPPTGEGAGRYLTDAVIEDGLRLGRTSATPSGTTASRTPISPSAAASRRRTSTSTPRSRPRPA